MLLKLIATHIRWAQAECPESADTKSQIRPSEHVTKFAGFLCQLDSVVSDILSDSFILDTE